MIQMVMASIGTALFITVFMLAVKECHRKRRRRK